MYKLHGAEYRLANLLYNEETVLKLQFAAVFLLQHSEKKLKGLQRRHVWLFFVPYGIQILKSNIRYS